MMYQVSYYRHDKKITETKPVKADTMVLAVKRLVETAKYHNTVISSVSCKIDGSNGLQRFCDTCLVKEATYGYKDNKMNCNECRNDKK